MSALDPVAVQYLSLTDAMGYDSTSNLSPEEWAAELVKRAAPVVQPLTDEQIAALAWRIGMGPAIVAGSDVVGFARAVMALQRGAQPLTDEQARLCITEANDSDEPVALALVRIVERAHGIRSKP